MKYDDLEAFREYIHIRVSNENTARRYYGAVVKLFRNVDVETDIKQMSADFYHEKIPLLFKSRNEVSAIKNGLKYFREFLESREKCAGAEYREAFSKKGTTVCFPEENFYHGVNQKKRNRSKKPGKVLYLDEIQRKVNQIQDVKVKYAYRLALISGLRVSELAGLDADHVTFQNGQIFVNVVNGKGGSNGIVECLPDPYLYDRLRQHTQEHPTGQLFYEESTLRKKAWKLQMECHDFRRIFAITKRNLLKQEMPVEEANSVVQKSLRHVSFSTTKRYLFNRKLKIKRSRKEGRV